MERLDAVDDGHIGLQRLKFLDMKVFAHRGISALFPENSIAAFDHCLNLPVYGVEFDIREVDGQFVVFHDANLKRIFGVVQQLDELTKSELEKLLGQDGNPIPFLHHVLSIFQHSQHVINVELKSVGNAQAFLAELYRCCQQFKIPLSRFIISSFDHDLLARLNANDSELKLSPLMYQITEPVEFAFPIHSINLDLEFLTPDSIAIAQQYAVPIYVFTVDNEQDISWLLEHKVDGIFANHPSQATKIINKLI